MPFMLKQSTLLSYLISFGEYDDGTAIFQTKQKNPPAHFHIPHRRFGNGHAANTSTLNTNASSTYQHPRTSHHRRRQSPPPPLQNGRRLQHPPSSFLHENDHRTPESHAVQGGILQNRPAVRVERLPSSPINTALVQNNTSSIATAPPPEPSLERQAQILQELPGIGTWAGRQRLFSVKPPPVALSSQNLTPPVLEAAVGSSTSCMGGGGLAAEASRDAGTTPTVTRGSSVEDDDEDDGDTFTMGGAAVADNIHRHHHHLQPVDEHDHISNTAALQQQQHQQQQQQQQWVHPLLARSNSTGSSEARHRHEAWRWRFSRKWEAEQRSVIENPGGNGGVNGGGGDDADDLSALEYLQACGMGMDLQMMETQQRRGSGRRRRRRSTSNRTAATKSGLLTTNTTAATQTSPLLRSSTATTSSTTIPLGAGRGVTNNNNNTAAAVTESVFAFASPLRRGTSSVSTGTMQFDVEASYASGGGDLLAAEDSDVLSNLLASPDVYGTGNNGQCSTPSAAATHDLLNVALRGRQLLARQKEFEKEAAARWEQIERNVCGGSQSWAGTHLSQVDIDMSGRFPFVVLRIAEQPVLTSLLLDDADNDNNNNNTVLNANMSSGSNTSSSRQRFMVRGRQGATPTELLEEEVKRAALICSENGFPPVIVTTVGAGLLEWRSDTDRHVLLSPAPVVVGGGGAVKFGAHGGGGGVGGGSPPEGSRFVR